MSDLVTTFGLVVSRASVSLDSRVMIYWFGISNTIVFFLRSISVPAVGRSWTRTVDKNAVKQEAPAANLGRLSTVVLSLGNQSLTEHAPAIQPKQGDSTAGNGRESSTETRNNLTTMTAEHDSITTSTTAVFDSSISSTNDAAHLEVTGYQYTFRSHPGVGITVRYGSRNTTQTWEVRDGMIYIAPATGDSSSSTDSPDAAEGSVFPQGNGTGDPGPGAEAMSSTGSPSPLLLMPGGRNVANSTSNVTTDSGTEDPPRQDRPFVTRRPGLTGPKIKVRNG
ncbi:MAG: hypothetical protein LQ348_007194 [Seirophora lacunosa]|nr:MAG: hypothetical protein LQ348_007194 [Seirophora lacunosa]